MTPSHEVAAGVDAGIDSPTPDVRAGEPTCPKQPAAAEPGPIYDRALQTLLPRLLQILSPPPWTAEASRRAERGLNAPAVQLRRQSAALALALAATREAWRGCAAALREHVRCALIGWRLTLRSDGVPGRRSRRNSATHAAVASCVSHLLSDAPEFAGGGLMDDLAGHLRWLATRHEASPWLEGCAIAALADGGALLEDKTLLHAARRRLRHWLARQDAEGWFPERGGADPGRLTLTVDTLARVSEGRQWAEAPAAIERALAFLLRVVHPDGSVGGGLGTCGFGFLSPYGVERLAGDFPEAAALAALCRERFGTLDATRMQSWSDDLCALLGARLAAARTVPSKMPQAAAELPAWRGVAHFPRAGLSVCATDAYHAVVAGRRGGAVHVLWRDRGCAFQDPGLTVTLGPTIRTTGRFDPRATVNPTPMSVTCEGILRRVVRPRRGPLRRLIRWLLHGRVPRRLKVQQHVSRSLPAVARRLHPPLNRFKRTVTFGDDWLALHDDIICRRRCRVVVCHPGTSAAPARWVDENLADGAAQAPLFVDGAKEVRMTRLFRNGELLDVRITRNGQEETPPAP